MPKFQIDGTDYVVKSNKFELIDMIYNFESFNEKKFNHLTIDEFRVNQAKFMGDIRRNSIPPKEFNAIYLLCHKRKGVNNKKIHISYYQNNYQLLPYFPLFKSYELSYKRISKDTVKLSISPIYSFKFKR